MPLYLGVHSCVSSFERRELELGREFDVVDEQGNKFDIGADYPDELTDPADD